MCRASDSLKLTAAAVGSALQSHFPCRELRHPAVQDEPAAQHTLLKADEQHTGILAVHVRCPENAEEHASWLVPLQQPPKLPENGEQVHELLAAAATATTTVVHIISEPMKARAASSPDKSTPDDTPQKHTQSVLPPHSRGWPALLWLPSVIPGRRGV